MSGLWLHPEQKTPIPPLARLAVGFGTKATYCPGPKGCRDKWPETKAYSVVVRQASRPSSFAMYWMRPRRAARAPGASFKPIWPSCFIFFQHLTWEEGASRCELRCSTAVSGYHTLCSGRRSLPSWSLGSESSAYSSTSASSKSGCPHHFCCFGYSVTDGCLRQPWRALLVVVFAIITKDGVSSLSPFADLLSFQSPRRLHPASKGRRGKDCPWFICFFLLFMFIFSSWNATKVNW